MRSMNTYHRGIGSGLIQGASAAFRQAYKGSQMKELWLLIPIKTNNYTVAPCPLAELRFTGIRTGQMIWPLGHSVESRGPESELQLIQSLPSPGITACPLCCGLTNREIAPLRIFGATGMIIQQVETTQQVKKQVKTKKYAVVTHINLAYFSA